MKLIISQLFMTTDKDGAEKWSRDQTYKPKAVIKGYVRKTLDNPDVYPHVGDYISSALWDRDFSQQKVAEVTFDYDESECFVTLPNYYIVKGSTWDTDFESIIRGHGWEVR